MSKSQINAGLKTLYVVAISGCYSVWFVMFFTSLQSVILLAASHWMGWDAYI